MDNKNIPYKNTSYKNIPCKNSPCRNITIIGAGPVGCYTGYLLAKSGHQVDIYEQKAELGIPIQCTGLVTAGLEQFNFPLEEFLINTTNKIEVYTPKQKLAINQKEYVICRRKFDNYLAGRARQAGVRIHLNHAFLRKEGNSLIIKDKINGQEKILLPEIVIAADGPLSPTAKAFGFYHPEREHFFGIQAVVEGNFEPAAYQAYFGNEICPELFAWIVPESSSRARVGLAARKNTQYYFNQLIKEKNKDKNKGNSSPENDFKIKEIQAGVIPLYHPKQKIRKGNCYLVGDASSFVKATTLGGLIPGLKQAEILAKCLSRGKDYEQEVKPLRKEMNLHLRLHRIFRKFSDRDWDRLVSYAGQPRIQKVFEAYSRDNPIPLVAKALWKEPRLLRFGKYLFKRR